MSLLAHPETQPSDPAPLHDHALASLRVIRSAMERAGSFTAVPGWGSVAIGVTALAASWLAQGTDTGDAWLKVWIVEGLLAAAISAGTIAWKAKRLGIPVNSGPARKFALAFLPSLAAGAVLTVALASHGLGSMLPGTWLLLYGTAVTAGGALSVRIVPLMGLVFMLAGVAALWLAPNWGNACMAAGFGGVHVGFGVWIARRHGG